MALRITDECIFCGACAPLCPEGAIAPGTERFVIDGTRCTECGDERRVPECADVCPVDCCVPETAHQERAAAVRGPRAGTIVAGALVVLALGPSTTGCSREAKGPPVIELATVPRSPGTGEIHFVVNVKGARGGVVRGRAVGLAASLPPRPPLPEMEVAAVASEERAGRYDAFLNLAARGRWSVVVTVRDRGRVLAQRTFPLDVH